MQKYYRWDFAGGERYRAKLRVFHSIAYYSIVSL